MILNNDVVYRIQISQVNQDGIKDTRSFLVSNSDDLHKTLDKCRGDGFVIEGWSIDHLMSPNQIHQEMLAVRSKWW